MLFEIPALIPNSLSFSTNCVQLLIQKNGILKELNISYEDYHLTSSFGTEFSSTGPRFIKST